jgi:ectoine hydroxylase-related dioxygenase (phytanoyl-CoA dioxygenase family)
MASDAPSLDEGCRVDLGTLRREKDLNRPFGGAAAGWPLVRWLAKRPLDALDLLPQLVDKLTLARPVPVRGDVRRAVADLDRDGVTVLERVAPAKLIEEARRDMERFVQRITELEGTTRTKPRSTGGTVVYPVHEYQRGLNIYRSHDPLMFSAAYAQFLLLPQLREVAAGYLGRTWRYQAMIATRTQPSPPTREGFASWHHDARGRKLNIIMPLTDVLADGSATVVMAGSHRLVYLKARRLGNVFSDEEVAALQRQYGWTERVCDAPAGSLILFDSQALHLGRRSPHSRDAFQVNCMTKSRHLWPQEISRAATASLPVAAQRELLSRANLRVI